MVLDTADQGALALWASVCAEHVLPLFETQHPHDDRPRNAIEVGRAWASSEASVSDARTAAFAAHAAARDADEAPARAAARAAGHAAATAHDAGHSRHAAAYAVKAITYAADSTDTEAAASEERDSQVRRLPDYLRPVVFLDP